MGFKSRLSKLFYYFGWLSKCLEQYVIVKVESGAYLIDCPSEKCPQGGKILVDQVESIAGKYVKEKHIRFQQQTGGSTEILFQI